MAGLQPLRDLGQVHRPRRDRAHRPDAGAGLSVDRRRRRPTWSTRRRSGACRRRTPRSRCARSTVGAGVRPASARRASAACATPRSLTTAGTPGEAALGGVMGAKNIKAVAVQGRPAHGGRPRGGAGGGQGPARAVLGPATAKYRELGTPATCWRSTRSTPCPPATSSPPPSPRHPCCPPRIWRRAGRSPGTARLLHHRLRAHLCRQGRQDGEVEYENVFALGPMRGIRP